VLFHPGGSRILDSRGDIVCMVVPEGLVFRADFSQSYGVERCFFAGSSSELWKWHRKLGHVGGYPKNSDDSPNTREKVFNTFKHKVRALRGSDSLSRLHKSQKSESVYTCPRAPFYREMKGLLHS
jgi:hypothetical protein